MPYYEYEFLDNGELVEVKQNMSDEILKEIDGRPVKRKMGKSTSVLFMGRGWPGKDIKNKETRLAELADDPLKTTLPEYRKLMNENIVWNNAIDAEKEQKRLDREVNSGI